jgi:parvulin-like peptidyl-prolyl isomerase
MSIIFSHQGAKFQNFAPYRQPFQKTMFQYSRTLLVVGTLGFTPFSLAAQTSNSSITARVSAGTGAPEKIVLTVDGHSYTARDLDNIIAAIVPPGSPITGSVKRQVAALVVETRLLADEAIKRGLDKDSRTQSRVAFAQDQALGQAVAYEIAEDLMSREARKYYEAHQDGFEQITARHILIGTSDSPVPPPPGKPALTTEQAKAKAEELRQRLLKGEDFAKIAAAESYDTNASRGGELPPFRRMQMAPEFENAAFAAKIGEITEPVKSIFGYHIIQVMKRGPAPFDEVKFEIAHLLERPNFQKFLQDLKQTHPAIFDDNYFGPPAEQSSSAPASLLMRRGS